MGKTFLRKLIPLYIALSLSVSANALSSSPDITPEPGQVNPYRTRSELLMDAARYTGVCTPEQAADVWAKGLEMRSAAMQYTVMTDALKDEYARQLDALRSNWVTGVSSPWVESHTFTEIQKPCGNRAEITLRFTVTASAVPPEYYSAALELVREGDFWRIAGIRADENLYIYTLYAPESHGG